MLLLKNIALFLFGIVLIVLGFRANTDKAAPDLPDRKESVMTGEASPEGEAMENRPSPEKSPEPGAAPDGRTRLEKKTPENAGGSK